jgi:putative ABC transport system ATP-binding protein
LLAEAGIAGSARARLTSRGILISAAAGKPRHDEPADADGRPSWLRDAAASPAEVELRALGRAYGRGRTRREVVRDLSFSFAQGRLTALTGRSGSGKTTLLRMIAGLDLPDEGGVLIDGRALGGDRESRASLRRQRVGYLPQEPWPVGFLSAAENVALALRVRGWDQDAAAKRAASALAQVRLADRARQRVERLSAGERQRVALARALASARGLLLIDEPTSRLDSDSAGEVGVLLAAAAAHGGQTVICATHDPQVVRVADDVLELGAAAGVPPGD